MSLEIAIDLLSCLLPITAGKGNTDLIEKLQRGAARIIMKSPSSDEALEKLRYDTLESRGEKYILKLVRKCLTGQVPQCFNDYFTFNRNVVKRVTRQSGLLHLPRVC